MIRTGGERGWAAVFGLAVLAAVFSVVHPAVLIFVPFAVLLLALPPRRPLTVVMGVLIVALFFFGEQRQGPLWYMERGWVLMLSAWFVAAVVALPRSGFLARGLTAVFATAASVALLLTLGEGSFGRADEVISQRLTSGAQQVVAAWRSGPAGSRLGQEFSDTVSRAVELQAVLFPALLALASLCGLAVAWWAHRRLAAREPQPLAPLREFRFHDGMIWLLIVAMLLLLLPLDGFATRAGSNLLAFMAALYALRGLAVLLVIGGAPGPLALVLGGVLLLLLYPIVVATTFFVGLTDTWLDIRTRRAVPPGPGPGGMTP